MIQHCCRLCHSATHEETGSSRCLQLGVYAQLDRPLRSGRIGSWDARRLRIALCAARCVCGSSSCAQAASACRYVRPRACLCHWAWKRSWGGECAASRSLVRTTRTLCRVLTPRAYLGSRCTERHELACAMWGTRASCGTFGVGRRSDTWDLMQKSRSDRLLGALGVVRAQGLIYEGQASSSTPRLIKW